MKLAALLEQLDSLVPLRLAESWDRVGLHLGDGDWSVSRGMVCIDLTPAVLGEAVEMKADLVIAYHPPIFEPLRSLVASDPRQRMLLEAARRRIALYSPHTALDAVAGGVNDFLCEPILPGWHAASIKGLASLPGGRVRPLRRAGAPSDPRLYKLITFVPTEHAPALRQALAEAGAGVIGAYTHCSFTVAGQGTFRGGEGTRPAVGKAGQLEHVPEERIETVVPQSALAAVTAALRAAHPYEEPAFDLVALQAPPAVGDALAGQGRLIELEKSLPVQQLAHRLKRHLGLDTMELAVPESTKRVQRIGLCAGAGGSLLAEAGEVDLFITGEMRHHEVLAALARGTAILLAGHTQTERPYLPSFIQRLQSEIPGTLTWHLSKLDQAPAQRI